MHLVSLQSVVDEVRNCNLFYYDRLSEGIKEIAFLNRRGWNFFEPNSCRVYRPFINAAKYANIIKFAEDRVGILFVKCAMTYLIDDQAARPHQTAETGICLSCASCGCKAVTQLGGLNEIGLHSVLAAGITKGLSQMRFPGSSRADESEISVRVDRRQ